jgi:hypothetical protein
MELIFFSFNMYVKRSYSYAIIYIIFISSLTIFNLPHKQWYNSKLQFSNGFFMDFLSVEIGLPYLSINQDLKFSSFQTLKLD